MRLSLLPICGLVMFAGAPCALHGAARPGQTANTNPKHVPHTPIDKKKAELGESTWNPQWNGMVEQALPASLFSEQVPRDVRRFCPRFFTMTDTEKRAFWAYFFQALAGAEAGLNPQATVRHDEPKLARREKVAATRVRTEGLLQLTYADQTRYGCPFDEQADRGLPPQDPTRTILQPKNNLTCGVMILENQLITQRKPLLSPTSYWATLRPGTVSYRIFAKQMTNPPAACGLRPVHGRRKVPLKQIAQ